MGMHITALHDWFQTPAGRVLMDWERQQMDAAVADVFGYQALQLGLPDIDALAANRMPHRWLALDDPARTPRATDAAAARHVLDCDFAALPFSADTLDLVVLPHTLELNAHPHATLREVHRVLVHEGRVVITGFNPASLWGWRQRRARVLRRMGIGRRLFLPQQVDFISIGRLRDWLHLLGFEVAALQLGVYRAASHNVQRWAWLERVGARLWPVLGAAYCVVAIKRQHGMKLLGPAWKTSRLPVGDAVSIANSSIKSCRSHDFDSTP